MEPSEARELKQLREENVKLKCLFWPTYRQGDNAGHFQKVLKPVKA